MMQTRERFGRAARDRGSSLFGVSASSASFVTDEMLLGSLISANFNVTTDQAIPVTTGYIVTTITVTNASVSMDTAVGGFYTEAAKGGTEIVAATQVYSALTSAAIILTCTTAAAVGGLDTVYFSLTTAQGAPATADIRIYGVRA